MKPVSGKKSSFPDLGDFLNSCLNVFYHARNLEPVCALMASDFENTAVKPLVGFVWEKTIILEFKKNGKADITVLALDLFLTVLPVKEVDSY